VPFLDIADLTKNTQATPERRRGELEMKKIFAAVLVLLVVMMMGSANGAAKKGGSEKVWKHGKNSITISFSPYDYDKEKVNIGITFNESGGIFYSVLPKEVKNLPVQVAWSGKNDFAVIFFYMARAKGSLIVYDFKTGDVTRLFPHYCLGQHACGEGLNMLVDMSKIKKFGGICLGKTSAKAYATPPIVINSAGEIKYAVEFMKNQGQDMADTRIVPDVCRKGRLPVDNMIIEEVVQDKNGNILHFTTHYSDDSYQEE
jgi:hypothetical protein